ncbi:cation diffusion facilitator family transporter [Paenibacillus sp. KN14-4R]|uniref:cation diffusion facilitator family transporter n=1 Tax=Paenibacillus sp. KN14-4R TaxID=3445773 RepID=UPI003F9EBE41
MTVERLRKAAFAAWSGIAVNVILAVTKGFVGWFSGSKALLADAIHSASQVAGSFAVMIGQRAGKMAPQPNNPYGRGRAEYIASVIVSLLMLIVGVEIGISAIKSIYHGGIAEPNGYSLIVIVVSIIVKEAMFRYQFHLGKKTHSPFLSAHMWSHRSDLYCSLAALVGVGGAYLGQLLSLSFFNYLDPLAGLIISFFVLKMGYDLMMEAIYNTLDRALHHEDAQELIQTVQRVKGVIIIEELRAREHGHYVIVDVKISVNPRITVQEGQEIAKTVKTQLMKRFIHISDVYVHVFPYDPGYPYKNNLNVDHSDFPSLLH